MNSLPQFLPWHADTARMWLAQRERFAHAWLVHGLPGIGKRAFAQAAAASLLCEQPEQGLACGRCAACRWVAGGNHPDLRRIRPDAVAHEEGDLGDEDAGAAKKTPSRDIRVEQLRELSNWFNTATHRGGWRVAVIYPARAMNLVTANALLKVLEEPPEHTVFLLVADAPDRLLPTLVSRCRRLPLPVPGREASLAWLAAQDIPDADLWLAAAGGAPLLARDLARKGGTPCPDWLGGLITTLARDGTADIGQWADQLEKEPAEAWIDALQRVFVDLSLQASGAPLRYFPALSKPLGRLGERASRKHIAQTAQWLCQQRAVASHPLNSRLLVHTALQRVVLACAAVSP
ncbi:DNA polymerase III subunit delta' [Allopusillimonas soli]|uniref:DNA polymerase III subunit delta n=1 Tax=Allopusillimonas soli TaxID=659016 RepID=A0A853F9V2_9BURK|nr:DNA polymerase III subunit delta' [Allopusillimonas soli]NYT36709.1 DNA polymerase III subunit delta' [Allopusillimonas soli]TEA75186.1 DNA polymerase III subunit delta' [Allopusillimonas soli]